MKFFAHLHTAMQVIALYKGPQPFGIFIKDFFRQDKKYGSRDRKNISHLCYCYFRLGKSFSLLPAEERIVAGLFLCSVAPHEMLARLKPEWNEQVVLPVEEKYTIVNAAIDKAASSGPADIFPWPAALSAGIDATAFSTSFLVQPHLFLRIRPGKRAIVIQKLEAAGMAYHLQEEHCITLPNASKIDEVINLDQEAVIQDYSSQRVGELLQHLQSEIQNPTSGMPVWDCCAASGGKSILAWDVLGGIDLTVSDIRESIIANLKKRFERAGINRYRSFVADLSNPGSPLPLSLAPVLILADVPCSGSGTWSRTPEQLYYFDPARILYYQALQKKIASRVLEQLPSGGYFLYITCSVFRQENEAVVDFIQQQFSLEIVKMELLKGYDRQADTMFAALLRKP